MLNSRILLIAICTAVVLFIGIIIMNARDMYKGIPGDIQPEEVQTTYDTWHKFSSPDGQFKVMMPTLPQNAQETTKNDDGNQLVKYDLYVSEKNDGSLFIIMRKIYATTEERGDAEGLLKSFLADMLASNTDNELIAANETKFQGLPALDFAFRNNQAYVEGKVFTVGRMLYSIYYTSGLTNHNLGDFQYFIGSFTLNK